MAKEAIFIRKIIGWRGDARLYKLSEPTEYNKPWDDDAPPAKTTDYIIVSAAHTVDHGPETYIFPALEDGDVLDWGELDGSFRGGLDHKKALKAAGYILTESEA